MPDIPALERVDSDDFGVKPDGDLEGLPFVVGVIGISLKLANEGNGLRERFIYRRGHCVSME